MFNSIRSLRAHYAAIRTVEGAPSIRSEYNTDEYGDPIHQSMTEYHTFKTVMFRIDKYNNKVVKVMLFDANGKQFLGQSYK